jgi:hypothetical protein
LAGAVLKRPKPADVLPEPDQVCTYPEQNSGVSDWNPTLTKLGDQRMKNKLLSASLLLAAGLFFGGSSASPTNEKVSLELLNPTGVIEPLKNIGLTPRISDLAGKKIALMHSNKSGAANLYTALEVLLKQK